MSGVGSLSEPLLSPYHICLPYNCPSLPSQHEGPRRAATVISPPCGLCLSQSSA